VKYGLLGDADFFDWLEGQGPALAAGDVEARIEAVRRSVQMKADIVMRDETEQGERALLNLGHTFGHALEAATGYSDRLLHGEGVAIGCALAFELSSRMGLCAQEAPSRVRAHLSAMGMKVDLADIEGDLPDAHGLCAGRARRRAGAALVQRRVQVDIPAFAEPHEQRHLDNGCAEESKQPPRHIEKEQRKRRSSPEIDNPHRQQNCSGEKTINREHRKDRLFRQPWVKRRVSEYHHSGCKQKDL